MTVPGKPSRARSIVPAVETRRDTRFQRRLAKSVRTAIDLGIGSFNHPAEQLQPVRCFSKNTHA